MIPFGYHKEIIKVGIIFSHLVKGEDHKLDLNGAHVWFFFMRAFILVKFSGCDSSLD
jgi:hypothetical protein